MNSDGNHDAGNCSISSSDCIHNAGNCSISSSDDTDSDDSNKSRDSIESMLSISWGTSTCTLPLPGKFCLPLVYTDEDFVSVDT